MKKVIVDEEKCIRCGACIGIGNEIFKYGDDGQSVPAVDAVSDNDKNAIAAMESCPTGAISLEDVDEGNCEHCNCDSDCNCGEDCDCHKDGECNCDNCDCQ